MDTGEGPCYLAFVHILIALDDGHGVLDPVTTPLSTEGPPEKQLGCAAELVAALVNCGTCKIYELKGDEWVLEVRLAGTSGHAQWIH